MVVLKELWCCCGVVVMSLYCRFGGMKVGHCVPPYRPGFFTTAPKVIGIFWNASVTFPRYILATERPPKFPISVTVPKFWWETKGTPDGEKLVSRVSRVRRAADGKI